MLGQMADGLGSDLVDISFFPSLAQGWYKKEVMAMELAETAQRLSLFTTYWLMAPTFPTCSGRVGLCLYGLKQICRYKSR